MRVLLNGLTALKPRTGIGQYTARLAVELEAILPPDSLRIYPHAPWDRLARRMLSGHGAAPSSGRRRGWMAPAAQLAKSLGRAAAARHFAFTARKHDVTLYHEPNYIPFATQLPTVITIHDLSVLLQPEWHPADRVREHARKLERAAADAVHIIADTQQVRREIMAQLGVPAERVTAVHLGVAPEFRPCSEAVVNYWRLGLDLPERFFLCVGTIEPRKNLLVVMRAFASLPAAERLNCPLLLVGPWGWRSSAEHDFYVSTGRDAGIRHLGYLPDAAMPAVYSAAAALLYPSLYEGFGLPPLEAAACGCPAICSRGTAAVAEVMHEAATYCEPHDDHAWREAMLHAVHARGTLANISRLQQFTWSNTARNTLAVYQRVLGLPAISARAA